MKLFFSIFQLAMNARNLPTFLSNKDICSRLIWTNKTVLEELLWSLLAKTSVIGWSEPFWRNTSICISIHSKTKIRPFIGHVSALITQLSNWSLNMPYITMFHWSTLMPRMRLESESCYQIKKLLNGLGIMFIIWWDLCMKNKEYCSPIPTFTQLY